MHIIRLPRHKTRTPTFAKHNREIRFGLEVEFLYPADSSIIGTSSDQAKATDRMRAWKSIGERLTQAGLPAGFRLDWRRDVLQASGYPADIIPDDDALITLPADIVGNIDDVYRLATDRTLGLDELWTLRYESDIERLRGRVLHPTELNTPVLDPRAWARTPSLFARMIGAVRGNTPGVDVIIGDGMGTHVHVSEAGEIYLWTHKHFVLMVFVLEFMLLALCGPDRSNAHAIANWHPGRDRRVPALGPSPMGFDLPRWMPVKMKRVAYKVWGAESSRRINKLLTNGQDKIPAVAYRQHVRGSADQALNVETIEIRYAPVSFDSRFIDGWTSLILGMFHLSMLEEEDFSRVMSTLVHLIDSGVSVLTVMAALRDMAGNHGFQVIYDEEFMRRRLELLAEPWDPGYDDDGVPQDIMLNNASSS